MKMKTLAFLSLVLLLVISSCVARDLVVGTTYNTRLTWQQKENYMAIPFRKRVKNVFYNDPGQRIVRGIVARDLDRTDASATITAGGVGSTFVNIRLKSTRGGSLNYQIEIYV